MRNLSLGSLFFIFGFSVSAQIGTPASSLAVNTATLKQSNIVRSSLSDTVFFPLHLLGASYDIYKKNLPFFVVHHATPFEETAVPEMQIKRINVVGEPHASVIKKHYLNYLSNKFELKRIEATARRTNLNQYHLIPFRLNELNQIEELVEYSINWKFVTNSNAGARGAAPFKNNSVLATGNWYKIAIPRSGIYRLNRNFFSNIGINPSEIDPRNIRIYGNGGKMLPELNSEFRIDDLEENAIKVIGESDGVFDNSDYVLFYGQGVNDWRFDPASNLKFKVTKNLYSDSSYYFINVDLGRGKRILNPSGNVANANVSADSYDYYNFHEVNVVNFGKSGRDFFGEYFDVTNSYTFNWDDGHFVVGDTLVTEVALVAAGTVGTEFLITGNGNNFKVTTGAVSGNLYSDYAAPGKAVNTVLNNNNIVLSINVSKLTARNLGWLDKLTVNCRRRLNLGSKQFNFRDTRTVGAGKVASFTINTPLNAQLLVWDVSNPLSPLEQQLTTTPSTANFIVGTEALKEFCVAPTNDFLTPTFVGKITNQNLHSLTQADYIIVTHPLFVNEAKRLAVFHQKNDGLTYAIATVEEIYNEFSSGRQDIVAIRDFVRMLYSRNLGPNGKPVKYLLLMGDGSFNNMNRSLVNNSNLIPTYQSHNSLSSTQSIATDDFYGMMDPWEGYNAEREGRIDIGIGRFTCRTVSEVRAVIAKIEHYSSVDGNFQLKALDPENCNTLNEGTMGDWRNWLLFLGDDEDSGLHMIQSDDLSAVVNAINPGYNADKIFLDAYQRFSTPGGPRYPDASADFVRRIKKGALIFNYTGHGGEVGLTAERMIDIDIINALDNFNKLPLFITATCEFSRYDDPGRTSAGELCLLNPKGGAIALFTTCRLAYSGPNYTLNKVTLEKLFTPLPNGEMPTLGEAIQLTKADPITQTQYYTNFHLLGDPALRLSFPKEQVVTSIVNNMPVSQTISDTLGALAKITISGYVADKAGNKLTNFNGVAFPTVFDKEVKVSALMNTPSSAYNYDDIVYGNATGPFKPFQFNSQKNILYRGKALVTNGDFSFTFIVPKDISFAIGPGKISYYATDGVKDAQGYYGNLMVGGASKNGIIDNEGPSVSLYLNDKNFINGGLTSEKPVLYADLIDSSGINTLGSGIGHDISVILDENTAKPTILNDYYEANLNSYQSGRVRYPFSSLSEGEHRLSFRVWDIQNNSSVVHTDFIVAKSAELALKHVLNYPNPFTTRTKFFFEHNQACNPLKVNIQVYTVSGKLVKTIQENVVCEGFRPEGINWDGRDDFGDKLARGVYLYKLSIIDVENKKAEKIEKLVILN